MNTLRALLLVALLAPLGALAQGTAFTFQGRLHDAGAPASGPVLLRVTPWDSATEGVSLATPVETGTLPLVDGVFTTTLDFGPAVFLGTPVWLEIEVDSDSGGYVVLTPRQPVTPTPYAMQAQTVAVDSIDAFALRDGAVERASIAPGAVGATQIDASEVQRRIGSPCVAGTVLQAISQAGSPTCVPVGGAWTLLPDGRQQSEVNVLVQPSDAASQPALTVLSGNQWSPSVGSGDGDLHIGTGVLGLSFGVATEGGGAGAVRIWTNGGAVDQLSLGSIAHGTVLAIQDDQVGIGLSNPQAALDVAGGLRLRGLANATVPGRRSVLVEPDGDFVAVGAGWISFPGSAFLPGSETVQYARNFYGLTVDAGQYTQLMAPLSLPDGMRITQARLHAIDNSASFDYQFYIVRIAHANATTRSALPVATSGADPALRTFQSPAGFSLLVDNGSYSHVAVVFPESGTWQGDASVIRGVSLRFE